MVSEFDSIFQNYQKIVNEIKFDFDGMFAILIHMKKVFDLPRFKRNENMNEV